MENLKDEPEPCASIDVYIVYIYVRTRGQYIQARWTSMSDSLDKWKEMVLLIDNAVAEPRRGHWRTTSRHHPLDDRVQAGFSSGDLQTGIPYT